jgi:hypothetical protein
MLDKALEKISDEMSQNTNNSYVQAVGDFLTSFLMANPQYAEIVLTAGKTISRSMDAMRTEASKKKSGNCAVLSDAEGFAIVLKYFGIGEAPAAIQSVPGVTAYQTPAAMANTSSIDFDVKLDDYL